MKYILAALLLLPIGARAQTSAWTGSAFASNRVLSAADLNAAIAYVMGRALTQGAADGRYQPMLGYTPVQQAGGAGQIGNKVFLGWDGVGLRAQIDATDVGRLQLASQLQGAISSALGGPSFPCVLDASGGVTVQSNMCVHVTDGSTGTTAGYLANINLTATSAGGSGDKVGIYSRSISASGSAGVWSLNTVMDVLPRPAGQPHAGTVSGYELDIGNTDCDGGLDPNSNTTCPMWGKGIWVTGLTGANFYAIRDAILVTATGNGTLAHYGLNFLGPYIDYNTIYDGTNSTVSLRIAGTHTDGIDFTRGTFSGAAIRLNPPQRLCWTSDCSYETHYDATNGVLSVNTLGTTGGLSVTGAMSLPGVAACSTETRSKYLCRNGNALQVNP